MDPMRRFSLFMWLLLSHLPPISAGRLLMPAVFLGVWTLLHIAIQLPQPKAFVWATVIAQAVQLFAVMPATERRIKQTFNDPAASTSIIWTVAVLFGFLALQIWWSEPWISQRIVSVYACFYTIIMVIGVWGNSDIIDRFAPVSNDLDIPLAHRKHVLKLYTLFAIELCPKVGDGVIRRHFDVA